MSSSIARPGCAIFPRRWVETKYSRAESGSRQLLVLPASEPTEPADSTAEPSTLWGNLLPWPAAVRTDQYCIQRCPSVLVLVSRAPVQDRRCNNVNVTEALMLPKWDNGSAGCRDKSNAVIVTLVRTTDNICVSVPLCEVVYESLSAYQRARLLQRSTSCGGDLLTIKAACDAHERIHSASVLKCNKHVYKCEYECSWHSSSRLWCVSEYLTVIAVGTVSDEMVSMVDTNLRKTGFSASERKITHNIECFCCGIFLWCWEASCRPRSFWYWSHNL